MTYTEKSSRFDRNGNRFRWQTRTIRIFLILWLTQTTTGTAAVAQGREVTWRALVNSAESLYDAGKYKEGLIVARKAVDAADKANNSELSMSLSVLANFHTAQGQYTEAEPLYKRALSIREDTLGP